MRTPTLIASLLALVIQASGPTAQAAPALTDHPLVSPYEGSQLRRKDEKAFDEYQAFIGMDESGKVPKVLKLEGKVTKLLYTKPKDRSILEVFRNYEQAVTGAGAEILYRCDQEKAECAKAYAGPTLGKHSGIQSVANNHGRYLLGKIVQQGQVAYVAVAVGQNFTDVHVIEVKAMETGKAALDARALGEGLDARGFVVVEGIYFETDKAMLQAQSEPALKEMAALLQARPKLGVYVVGHTDSQGALAHNRSLSEARAQAVVDALAERHGIERARMEGHGVGPLAPQASNASDDGRARNRRVVLVSR